MNINIIVAVDQNRAIGLHGDQLAYISADLKHFKSLTSGHTIIMGRRTSEALPKGFLPNRRNIVISRNINWHHENVETAQSIQQAINMVKNDGEVFIIGGAQIYEAFLPLANRLYLTLIESKFQEADTYFPPYDDWQTTSASESFTDEKSGLKFRFLELEKRP